MTDTIIISSENDFHTGRELLDNNIFRDSGNLIPTEFTLETRLGLQEGKGEGCIFLGKTWGMNFTLIMLDDNVVRSRRFSDNSLFCMAIFQTEIIYFS